MRLLQRRRTGAGASGAPDVASLPVALQQRHAVHGEDEITAVGDQRPSKAVTAASGAWWGPGKRR